jgi:hypothetical protein
MPPAMSNGRRDAVLSNGGRYPLIDVRRSPRTLHPSAGADPIVVLLSGAAWPFLLTPILAGTLAIVITAGLRSGPIRTAERLLQVAHLHKSARFFHNDRVDRPYLPIDPAQGSQIAPGSCRRRKSEKRIARVGRSDGRNAIHPERERRPNRLPCSELLSARVEFRALIPSSPCSSNADSVMIALPFNVSAGPPG